MPRRPSERSVSCCGCVGAVGRLDLGVIFGLASHRRRLALGRLGGCRLGRLRRRRSWPGLLVGPVDPAPRLGLGGLRSSSVSDRPSTWSIDRPRRARDLLRLAQVAQPRLASP